MKILKHWKTALVGFCFIGVVGLGVLSDQSCYQGTIMQDDVEDYSKMQEFGVYEPNFHVAVVIKRFGDQEDIKSYMERCKDYIEFYQKNWVVFGVRFKTIERVAGVQEIHACYIFYMSREVWEGLPDKTNPTFRQEMDLD
jgi:hypothetical protein